MKNNSKRGFTIIEMVIVIAIIGILAAVLVPTYGNVVEKANASSALQTARSTMTNWLADSTTAAGVPQSGNNEHGNPVYAAYFTYSPEDSGKTYTFRYTAGGVEDVTGTTNAPDFSWNGVAADLGTKRPWMKAYILNPEETHADAENLLVKIFKVKVGTYTVGEGADAQSKEDWALYIEYPDNVTNTVLGKGGAYTYAFAGSSMTVYDANGIKYTLDTDAAADDEARRILKFTDAKSLEGNATPASPSPSPVPGNLSVAGTPTYNDDASLLATSEKVTVDATTKKATINLKENVATGKKVEVTVSYTVGGTAAGTGMKVTIAAGAKEGTADFSAIEGDIVITGLTVTQADATPST